MKKSIILILIVIDLILFGIASLVYSDNNKSLTSNINTNNNELAYYKNNYAKNTTINYVQDTNVKVLNNKQDLINVLYKMFNNGYDFYDFKCSNTYVSCASDILGVLNNRITLNVVNNLVNSYNSIYTYNTKISYLPNGDIRLYVTKKYSNEEINIINNRINYVTNMLINDKMTDKEKIKKVHDYLANNTTYGYGNKADTAYGALINGVAICGGYADAFSLFMDKLNIPNYKVVSNTHVWNVVYINNNWEHIDVTYDDPKNNYETNAISYDYFLVNTKTIKNNDIKEHNFDSTIYEELV